MKRIFALVLLLCCCFAGNGYAQQKKKAPIALSIPELPEVDGHCYRTNSLPFAERMQNYPFNRAAKITIASFRDKRTQLVSLDSLALCRCGDDFYSSVPVASNPEGATSFFEEEITLSPDRVNTLSSILYEYGYREGAAGPQIRYGCYYPHNAILFYDNNNEVFAYIELCFSCTGHETSYERGQDNITWCDGKIDLLKAFFSGCGIKTGTTIIPMLPDSLLDPGLK